LEHIENKCKKCDNEKYAKVITGRKKEDYILLITIIYKLNLLKMGENKYVGDQGKSVIVWFG
jgi:hypothetical protein